MQYQGREISWEEYLELIRPYLNTYGDQDENGVDLSLIRENLKLSPLERSRRTGQHARSVRRLNAIGEASRRQRA